MPFPFVFRRSSSAVSSTRWGCSTALVTECPSSPWDWDTWTVCLWESPPSPEFIVSVLVSVSGGGSSVGGGMKSSGLDAVGRGWNGCSLTGGTTTPGVVVSEGISCGGELKVRVGVALLACCVSGIETIWRGGVRTGSNAASLMGGSSFSSCVGVGRITEPWMFEKLWGRMVEDLLGSRWMLNSGVCVSGVWVWRCVSVVCPSPKDMSGSRIFSVRGINSCGIVETGPGICGGVSVRAEFPDWEFVCVWELSRFRLRLRSLSFDSRAEHQRWSNSGRVTMQDKDREEKEEKGQYFWLSHWFLSASLLVSCSFFSSSSSSPSSSNRVTVDCLGSSSSSSSTSVTICLSSCETEEEGGGCVEESLETLDFWVGLSWFEGSRLQGIHDQCYAQTEKPESTYSRTLTVLTLQSFEVFPFP